MKEIWKDIPGYEGLYQASNMGNIKSLGREVVRSNGVLEKRSQRILKQSDNGRNYKSVQLYKNGKSKGKYVHRLVMLTFEGYREDMVVDHINRVRDDNRLENLRYCTHRTNTEKGSRPDSSSKHIGVRKNRNKISKKWSSSIRMGGKRYYLGSFEEEEEAARAYQKALSDWKLYSINPKGEKLEKKKIDIFKPKSKGMKGKGAKIVLDINTGVFYDSLKEASKYYIQSYKYLSNAILYKPEKTPLRYA